MKIILVMLNNNQEYILATNDGEFMQITSFSKQDGGCEIMQWSWSSAIASDGFGLVAHDFEAADFGPAEHVA